MGNVIQRDCVNMNNLIEITDYEDVSLSVIRTGGAIEDNWYISNTCNTWAGAHAIETTTCSESDPAYGEWKVFMSHKGDNTCGWRRISTFWPSHLTTAEERITWQQTLKARLDALRV